MKGKCNFILNWLPYYEQDNLREHGYYEQFSKIIAEPRKESYTYALVVLLKSIPKILRLIVG